jgi:transposase
MRTATRLAVLMLSAGGFVGAGVTIANADSGDGNLACNGGEICFARDDGSYTYQKHFYYGASHDNYVFTNVTTGSADGGYLKNNADQIRNRDSSCDVKVVDDRGIYPDDVFTAVNDGNWKTISGEVDNENDRHERFNC